MLCEAEFSFAPLLLSEETDVTDSRASRTTQDSAAIEKLLIAQRCSNVPDEPAEQDPRRSYPLGEFSTQHGVAPMYSGDEVTAALSMTEPEHYRA